jgi:hypothetical protein
MLKVKILTKDLTVNENLKVDQAKSYIEERINSEEFKNYILNYSFHYQKCEGRLWWKNCYMIKQEGFWRTSLSREKIYEKIMSGEETLGGEGSDNEMDVFLQIDRRNRRGVIGYTNESTQWQWIYNWFFKSSSIEEIASNIVHEYCHKLGFDHDFRATLNREHSVPYAVGNFFA